MKTLNGIGYLFSHLAISRAARSSLMKAFQCLIVSWLATSGTLLESPRPYENARITSPDRTFTALINTKIGNFTEDKVQFISRKSGVRSAFDMTSEGGSNGRYILKAKWTPDSRFFVFSTFSASAHSSWNFKTYIYSVDANRVICIDDDVRPVTDPDFEIVPPHSVKTQTLNEKGIDFPSTTQTIELVGLFEKLKTSAVNVAH